MPLYSRLEGDIDQDAIIQSTTVKDSVDKYDSDNTLTYDGDSSVSGAQGYDTAARRIVFIDDTEATLTENKERGLTAPGWWEYMTYTDSSGRTRHKAQHLVAFKDAPANVADADDPVAADEASVITISQQPVNDTADESAGGTADFSVTAAASEGSVVYQWQYQTATGTRWNNLSGETSASLSLAGLTVADSGKKYRVKLTSTAGAEEVISDTATLTVVA